MIICHSKKFVVVHLEKTGGTTIEKAIEPHLKVQDLYIHDWMIYNFAFKYALTEHSDANVIQKFLGEDWNNYKKFAVIRNPVQLMRSMYSFAMRVAAENAGKQPPDGAHSAYAYSVMSDTGPDGFVDYMLSRDYAMVSPQSDRLAPMLNDGLVIDLSELNWYWENTLDWLGLPWDTPMVVRNSSYVNECSFSPDTVKRIKKHFEKDYDILPSLVGVKWY